MQFAVDAEGYLTDPDEWNKGFAKETARALGIQLTGDHWAAIRFMRAYYKRYGQSPSIGRSRKALTLPSISSQAG